jgi:SNF2 family DNA or RNA helicase
LSAKTTRENDRQRLRDQEQRRSQLERRLAKMGTTFADDPSRVVINTGKFEDQELIFLNEHIGKRIKPHQIEGVQFMWRELVMDEKSLQGCLLAHTMGLGKTLQVYVHQSVSNMSCIANID